ncbi:MAG: dTDP-4-dehydrorhamnose 3,5-epimerase [Caldisericaceae bacterium]|nr:dTDP-4-dehydrorhamnose 3,5-epimerase [Caldisericaceae bacterium]
MKKYEIKKTSIEGLFIIETKVFEDHRGFFIETYNARDLKKLGLNVDFVQDNHSRSRKGVLRGLHLQLKHPQGKLVRVTRGKVFDVAVDLRKNSKTFGKWFGVELSDKNHLQFYIPPGFAHGFLALEDETDFLYKCTDFYYPEYESGIIWNDPTINIRWPLDRINKLIISDKDKKLPMFKEVVKYL